MYRVLARALPLRPLRARLREPAAAARRHRPVGPDHRRAWSTRSRRTLFARYPDAAALAGADREEMEALLKPTGFFRAKTNSVMKLGAALVERFDGEVPPRMKDLVTLPGVGRKTANVVLGNAFGIPGITVDTHFGRLVRRFGWTDRGGPGQGRARRRRADPAQGLDDAVPRPDLPRPPHLPRQEARLRRLPGRPAVPVVRRAARPTRSRPPSCSSSSSRPDGASSHRRPSDGHRRGTAPGPRGSAAAADARSDGSRTASTSAGSRRRDGGRAALGRADAVRPCRRTAARTSCSPSGRPHLRSHARRRSPSPAAALDPGDAGPVRPRRCARRTRRSGIDPAGVDVVAELPALYLQPERARRHPGAGLVARPAPFGAIDPAEVHRAVRAPRRPTSSTPRPVHRDAPERLRRAGVRGRRPVRLGVHRRCCSAGCSSSPAWTVPWDVDVARPLPERYHPRGRVARALAARPSPRRAGR